MSTIQVELGERSYPIIIKNGIINNVGSNLKKMGFSGRAAVVTNPLVEKLYAKAVVGSLKAADFDVAVITVPDGEEFKTLEQVSAIYDGLINHRMERLSLVAALGGGVIGDMAGFAAATYQRGVPLVQIPTTLLSQVDSSVGGKTAVNHPAGKNLIGAFYQPKAVFIDPDTLKTLDKRELRAGLAEVVKYGVIWDKKFFEFLEADAKALFEFGVELTHAIETSCRVKAEVVAKDETEKDLRAILNFGHTFGHAVEKAAGYGAFQHGEAVAIGMALATRLSVKLGLCEKGLDERVCAMLESIGLPVSLPDVPAQALIDAMKHDKKVAHGAMRFVLVKGLGKVFLRDVKEAEIRAFLGGMRG